jgi:hypothetical protein
MAWSRGQSGSSYGIKYMKGIYSAGSWTWGSVRTISTSYDLAGWVNCLFDGTRILIAGLWYDGVSPPSVTITERDEADTTSINRNPGGSPGADPDYVESGSVSYDNRGNIYLIGLNTTTGKVICRVFDRTSQAWTTDAAGTNRIYGAAPGTTYLSAQRGYANKMITFVYTGTASSPYAVMYDFVQLNRPPSAPTLVAVAGTGSLRNVTWQHNDPEGDPQSKYQLRWRKVV